MSILIWCAIYLILGIFYAEGTINKCKHTEPSTYMKIEGMPKTIRIIMISIWLPFSILGIFKVMLGAFDK